MKRTFGAISIAALSGAIAGPPAFPQDAFSDPYSDFETESTRLDIQAGTVLRAGDGASDILFDLDGDVTFERFNEAGRRSGLVLGGRVQSENGHRGFGGLAGNCPPGQGDCAGLQGPASGLRTAGAPEGDDTRGVLDTAYIFHETGWGELRIGRTEGAARQDHTGGPRAFRLSRADGGRVDTGGLQGARTENFSSGQDAKILFRSIALGQETSVGTLRASASWTPSVRMCGLDHCAREYGLAGLVSPVFDDVLELGVHYALRRGDHEFEASLGLSHGDDATGLPGFDGLRAYDLGVRWAHGAWSAGARAFVSDNGLSQEAGYRAWSASAGYESGDWLWTLEYAGFSDDAVHVDGTSWQAGGSRLLGERWIAGFGVQAQERQEPVWTPAGRQKSNTDSLTAFLELGWQF
ncbi:porin [Maricaulis parjimensis]|uniref:porin n=1 Tax=Maricaulis parjimensis TaxID=144023 RepID=UPI0019395117|nr:porin [Maricaulis parjimensis]